MESRTRENSNPSERAQNKQNNKPGTAPLAPGDRVNDITWRDMSNALTTHIVI